MAFQNSSIDVPWNLRNRWRNALVKFKHLNSMISHIFRKGNQVADSLANFGCTLLDPVLPPGFIIDSLEKNKFGIPSFN
jgi:hypothetical protein